MGHSWVLLYDRVTSELNMAATKPEVNMLQRLPQLV